MEEANHVVIPRIAYGWIHHSINRPRKPTCLNGFHVHGSTSPGFDPAFSHFILRIRKGQAHRTCMHWENGIDHQPRSFVRATGLQPSIPRYHESPGHELGTRPLRFGQLAPGFPIVSVRGLPFRAARHSSWVRAMSHMLLLHCQVLLPLTSWPRVLPLPSKPRGAESRVEGEGTSPPGAAIPSPFPARTAVGIREERAAGGVGNAPRWSLVPGSPGRKARGRRSKGFCPHGVVCLPCLVFCFLMHSRPSSKPARSLHPVLPATLA